jgi:hypothetical protein
VNLEQEALKEKNEITKASTDSRMKNSATQMFQVIGVHLKNNNSVCKKKE